MTAKRRRTDSAALLHAAKSTNAPDFVCFAIVTRHKLVWTVGMFTVSRIAVGVLLSFLLQPSNLSAVEIIAHRGASFDAPENTLSAMKLAWEQKADAVELDLWFSQDGKLVVIHESVTKRIGGSANKVATQSWESVHQCDVGGTENAQF